MFETDANTQSPLQKSALNFVADALWEDFKAQRPLDGGVAFENELRQCRLDGSLGSLQRLDKFLLYIRSKINDTAPAFMHDDKNRNLIWFIGFYTGNVLAKIWKSTPNWLGRHDISKRYSHLNINESNPFTHVALDYLPKSQHTTAEYKHLFFVLEPIGKIVFTDASKPMTSVLGGEVESSLFAAVVTRMPEQVRQKVEALQAKAQTKKQVTAQTAQTAQIAQIAQVTTKVSKPDNIAKPSQAKGKTATNTSQKDTIANPSLTPQTTSPISAQSTGDQTQTTVLPQTSTQTSQPATQSKPAEAYIKNKKPDPLIRQDDFTALRADLLEMEAPLTQGDKGLKEYQQGTKVLDKFDKYIAKSVRADVSADNVAFSPKQQKARMQALKLLNKSAQLGNTSAMLKLSIYYFLGEGLPQDESKGFAWVQKAANNSDVRAQRQMSRLYYQGLGKEQDVEAGRYWLEKAAENGHQEAKTLLEHWNNSQTIMNEHRFEQSVNQRYIILGIMLGIIMLLLLVLI